MLEELIRYFLFVVLLVVAVVAVVVFAVVIVVAVAVEVGFDRLRVEEVWLDMMEEDEI